MIETPEEREVFSSMEQSSVRKEIIRTTAKPKQEQGEPVAYINIEKRRLEWAHDYMSWNTPTVVNLPRIPLYTTPQQRAWVGLTDEEIGMAFRAVFPVGGVVFTNGATEFAQTIERKLKERNL